MIRVGNNKRQRVVRMLLAKKREREQYRAERFAFDKGQCLGHSHGVWETERKYSTFLRASPDVFLGLKSMNPIAVVPVVSDLDRAITPPGNALADPGLALRTIRMRAKKKHLMVKGTKISWYDWERIP